MIIQDRSYNSQMFRPRPIIKVELEGQLILVATNWGSADSADKMLMEIIKYISATLGDLEVTTPFEFLPQLSSAANSLRIGTFLANELICRSDNRTDYTAGLELCLLLKTKNQISWLQYGNPNLYLLRKNKNAQTTTQALAVTSDLALCGSRRDLAPLPKFLLGIDPLISPLAGHFPLCSEDQILLYSGSESSLNFNSDSTADLNLNKMVSTIAESSENSPFWLGLVNPWAQS